MNKLIIILIISLILNIINFIILREYKKFNEFDKMLLLRRIEILKNKRKGEKQCLIIMI